MNKAIYLLALAMLLSLAAFGQDTARHPRSTQSPAYTIIVEVDSATGKLTVVDSVTNLPGKPKEVRVAAPNGRRVADSIKKATAGNTQQPASDTGNKQKLADGDSGKGAKQQPRKIIWWVALLSAVVGGTVGLSELVNRYKSFNTLLGRNRYSYIYVLINALASVLFYWIVVRYDLHLGPFTDHNIGMILTCGLGAMAFLRSSFFNYKDAAGKVIEIGPAALLTIYLRASERNFDQCLARDCVARIGKLMSAPEIKFLSASKDLPLLVLSSMQVLSDDEQKALAAEILKLAEDTNTTEDVKKIALGTILERYAGEDLLNMCVQYLKNIYGSQRGGLLSDLDDATRLL